MHTQIMHTQEQALNSDNTTPKPASIHLSFMDEDYELAPGDAPLSIGRASENDIQVLDEMVTRFQHGRCVFRKEGPIWIDWSTNGAFILSDDGHETYLHQSAIVLKGSGRISLGKRPEEGGKVIRYHLH